MQAIGEEGPKMTCAAGCLAMPTGCFSRKTREIIDEEARNISRKIDKQLKREAYEYEKEVKLLMLGAGESGKSTIAKQMKILHQKGYNSSDRKEYKIAVYETTIQSILAIVNAMETLGIEYENPQHKLDAKKIKVAGERFECNLSEPALRDALKRIWRDNGIQRCFQRSSEYQLNDSAKYYMDDLDRICRRDFLPSDQDILRTRIKTTGILETKFEYRSLRFTLIDVGGQRSERRKWMHCFQDVTAMIFCVALSEYNQTLAEDEETNRMQESLTLFQAVANNQFLRGTSLIIFLNKIDLFREKIMQYPLTLCFEKYDGTNTYDDATRYIKERFHERSFNHDSQTLYTHYTCATDTENIKYVFDAVADILVQDAIRDVGFV